MLPQECTLHFPKIWPGDQVFDTKFPLVDLLWNIIKSNIETNFQEY